jgi:hypothetical protein
VLVEQWARSNDSRVDVGLTMLVDEVHYNRCVAEGEARLATRGAFDEAGLTLQRCGHLFYRARALTHLHE